MSWRIESITIGDDFSGARWWRWQPCLSAGSVPLRRRAASARQAEQTRAPTPSRSGDRFGASDRVREYDARVTPGTEAFSGHTRLRATGPACDEL